MEVLASIQHAELRIGREFTKEEFATGKVGGLMISDDFNPDITVSNMSLNSPNHCQLNGTNFSAVLHLSAAKLLQTMLITKTRPSSTSSKCLLILITGLLRISS